MATVTRRNRKHGYVYRVEVRIKGHPAVSMSFDTETDAYKWGEDTEKALRGGGYIGDAPPGDMVFSDAIKRYLATVSQEKAATTHQRELTAAGSLLKEFSKLTLGAIKPADVAQYRDKRKRKVSASTIHKEFSLLSDLYNTARREWNLEIINPVPDVKKPSLPRGRLRMLNQTEIKGLLCAAQESRNKKLYPYIMLLLHTGMRPSEAAGLLWDQVEPQIIDLTKTKTDPRRVPLTRTAREILQDLRPEKSAEKPVFLPDRVSNYIQLRPNRFFQRSFDNAVRYALGDNPDFTMHDMRHTAASYLIMADILGHRQLDMVMKYTHLLDEHKIDAVSKIDRLGL
ncbi:tyrosine-type recombinase/integrase [Thermodesulfobacteriota bacterium]